MQLRIRLTESDKTIFSYKNTKKKNEKEEAKKGYKIAKGIIELFQYHITYVLSWNILPFIY